MEKPIVMQQHRQGADPNDQVRQGEEPQSCQQNQLASLLRESGYKGCADFCRRHAVSPVTLDNVRKGASGGPGTKGEPVYQLLAKTIGAEKLEAIRESAKRAGYKQDRARAKSRALIEPFEDALAAAGMTRTQFRLAHDISKNVFNGCLYGLRAGGEPESDRALQLMRSFIEDHAGASPAALPVRLKRAPQRQRVAQTSPLLKQHGYSGCADFCRRHNINLFTFNGVVNGVTGGRGSKGERVYRLLAETIGAENLDAIREATRLANAEKKKERKEQRRLDRRFDLALYAAEMSRCQFKELHNISNNVLMSCLHGLYSGQTKESARVLSLIQEFIIKHADLKPATLLCAVRMQAKERGLKTREVSKEYGFSLARLHQLQAGKPMSRRMAARHNTIADANTLPRVVSRTAETLLELVHDHDLSVTMISRLLGCSRETVSQICKGNLGISSLYADGFVHLLAGLTGRSEEEIAKFLPATTRIDGRPERTVEQDEYVARAREHYAAWLQTETELSDRLQRAGFATLNAFAVKHNLSDKPVLAALTSSPPKGRGAGKPAAKALKLLSQTLGSEVLQQLQASRQVYPSVERPPARCQTGRVLYPKTPPHFKSRLRMGMLAQNEAALPPRRAKIQSAWKGRAG